ncbi:hypothetical protein CWE09_01110 [Aliidiomarina minuta]|uniref:Uncharacterized protein n=1 Tax=Aliidiomarina minuta TaxID=880057 RepID=A0A432W5M1_9GAMM|nr:hypothetical protein [Aliidiomarina minuta]RUO25365.1 hypothetical protein CWE09_01110 [Aliidiomarina minuta]
MFYVALGYFLFAIAQLFIDLSQASTSSPDTGALLLVVFYNFLIALLVAIGFWFGNRLSRWQKTSPVQLMLIGFSVALLVAVLSSFGIVDGSRGSGAETMAFILLGFAALLPFGQRVKTGEKGFFCCPHCEKRISLARKMQLISKKRLAWQCPHCGKAVRYQFNWKFFLLALLPAVLISSYVAGPFLAAWNVSILYSSLLVAAVMTLLSLRLHKG